MLETHEQLKGINTKQGKLSSAETSSALQLQGRRMGWAACPIPHPAPPKLVCVLSVASVVYDDIFFCRANYVRAYDGHVSIQNKFTKAWTDVKCDLQVPGLLLLRDQSGEVSGTGSVADSK